ncbi:hypothetical protein [Streptomyces chiangmaiensis]|uniref:Uncharacterized protein n=1 Tax=Streptomyces chiangmaiensis TaxID=766497 RepID=A0ABU7FFN7_9ACTN|nr:hypothetical protein [Streptomyces chiangmaiensis]MED7822956.1 hypothetical protein [Streptomyces chiangmaiensis]
MESKGGDRSDDTDGTGAAGGDAEAEAEADRLTRLLGGLLIELGEKVREAGLEGVRILTDEEVQRVNVSWYRTGWEEHSRAVHPSQEPTGPHAPGHPADLDPSAAGRLLSFPESPGYPAASHPLPIVGAGEAQIRELMPHRRRSTDGGQGRERSRVRARGRQPEGHESAEARDADE